MERCSYGFYTKRTDPVDSAQKKKDQEKEPPSPSYQQLSKPADKQHNENQNVNVPVSQHVPAQQLLSPSHSTGQLIPSKDDSKDKNLLKVANSTTITLIENSTLNSDKDKEYPKNYFTLEPKIDKKDDGNKNSITITKTLPKQSPTSQVEKAKGQAKPAKRPLQYLETLAEKAGITFEDKYEAANTLLALDKQNNINRRPLELKQPKTEPENHNPADDYNRYRNQKEEDDKLQIQQQIIQQQQQQQQLQQLQQLQQHQLQQLQQQAMQRQHQQVLQQHIKNQQDQQELLQKQFQQQQQQQHQQQQQQQQEQQQQQQKPELLQVTQSSDGQQKFLQPLHTQQFNVPGIGEINLSFLASPQNNVNLVFDKNQKASINADIKPQQIVDGQTQVVQQQMSMSQHDSAQQHHQTVTVVSSMPNSMAHQVQQQQQTGSPMQQQPGRSMPSLHSLPQTTQQPQPLSSEWGHSRVQVIQQPLPNNAYLQQLYNTQGPLIMPGNIALHPGINSQQIQVIAAGKPFQGNQLAPHMLAQGKQVLQGQTAPFPGYTTIPTTQNQTFVFSPLSVINSQSNILPTHSQPTVSGIGQQKQNDMHKCGGKVTSGKVNTSTGQTVQAQCVQVSQPVLGAQQPTQTQIISPLQAGGQPMQFAPWQISGALPQVWTGGLPAGTIPAGGLLAPNPTLFIRGNQPDQTSMFIQHSPQNNVHHNTSIACATATTTKPRASTDAMSKGPRPLSNILPSAGIRPASSVSTQTNQAQTTQGKLRGKPGVRSPAPAAKQDAANQTNKIQHQMQPPKQQLLVMNANGQMTQITSVQDKQALTKNMQQQAMMQQQIQQQQQQQQQLLHQQQQQTQQMVQHYQQQAGMQMGMQPNGLPVGSVAQAMAGMPQTISMVQQIHPLSGMTQQGTIVGQLNTQSQNQISQVQAMQQQQQQSLVSGGMVQTSVGMQQPGLSHAAPMQTVADNSVCPQLTLPTQGGVGLMNSMQSVLPLQTALVGHVKSEEDKMPPPTPMAPLVVSAEAEPATTFTPTTNTVTSVTTAPTADTATSTTNGSTQTVSKTSPQKATTADASSSTSSAPAPSVQFTSTVSPQVVTTAASSSSGSSTVTSASTTPVSSAPVANKGNQASARSQTATHEVKTVSPLPVSDVGTKGALENIYYKGLPKAMVKPNILTHVIEGYVIQEASEPFAVNRPSREWANNAAANAATSAAAATAAANAAATDRADRAVRAERTDREPREARDPRESRQSRERRQSREHRRSRENREGRDSREDRENREDREDRVSHEARDSRDVRESRKESRCDEPPRKRQKESSRMERMDSASRITSSSRDDSEASSSKSCRNQPPEPEDEADDADEDVCAAQKWSVSEVCEFIRGIPGCANYADDFLMQEVDGEALLLIKAEHLVMALSMKLGPALKIVACIDALRPATEQEDDE